MPGVVAITNLSTFAAQVDTRFSIQTGPDEHIDATLIEAEPYQPARRDMSPGSTPPFSLLFAVPEDVELAQQIYLARHDTLGEFSIFMVPVGPGRMESVFN